MKNNKNFELSVRVKKMISFLCVLILIFTSIPLIIENAKVSAEMPKGELIRSEEGYLDAGETYTFDVSGFFDYTIVLAGNNEADFDLYGRWNDWPTTTTYTEKSISPTSLEYFMISGEETLYLMVNCFSGEGWYKVWVISGHYFWDSDRINNYLSGEGESNADSIENFDNVAIGFAFLSGPDSSDFDMYVKWGSIPTTSDYDDKGDSIYSQEICSATGSGTFNYMIKSYDGDGSYIALFLIFDTYEDYTYIWHEYPGIESFHPYDNNEIYTWCFEEAECNKMRVFFETLDLEAGYDYLYIYDEYDNLQWSYTNEVDDQPQYDVTTPWITCDSITIEMETDESVTKFGFTVGGIECQFGIDGGSGGSYIEIIEAEEICYKKFYYDTTHPLGQWVDDNQPNDVIKAHSNRKFFEHTITLNGGTNYQGTYKYYFRARSTIGSRITIGVNGITPSFQEDFLLSNQYRWYISDDFVVTSSPNIDVWAESYQCAEYIDKIILLKWKDNGGNQLNGIPGERLGQILDKTAIDSDGDGINDILPSE